MFAQNSDNSPVQRSRFLTADMLEYFNKEKKMKKKRQEQQHSVTQQCKFNLYFVDKITFIFRLV